MKTKRNTREYSRGHVEERALERYDLVLTDADYDELCKRASLTTGIVEQNGDDTQIISSIEYKGKRLTVVYSENRGYVTTLLPPRGERKVR